MHGLCGGAVQHCTDCAVQALSRWIRDIDTGEHRSIRLHSMSSRAVQQHIDDGMRELYCSSDHGLQWTASVQYLQPYAAEHVCLVSRGDVQASWCSGWKPD